MCLRHCMSSLSSPSGGKIEHNVPPRIGGHTVWGCPSCPRYFIVCVLITNCISQLIKSLGHLGQVGHVLKRVKSLYSFRSCFCPFPCLGSGGRLFFLFFTPFNLRSYCLLKRSPAVL